MAHSPAASCVGTLPPSIRPNTVEHSSFSACARRSRCVDGHHRRLPPSLRSPRCRDLHGGRDSSTAAALAQKSPKCALLLGGSLLRRSLLRGGLLRRSLLGRRLL